MSTLDDFFSRALQLPPAVRAALAHQLILSLEPVENDPQSEALWAAEIEARLDKVARGDFLARDWREVIASRR